MILLKGPIPFIYCAEIFPSESRSAAIAVCMLTNWMSNLVLTTTFIYINSALKPYTFLIFAGTVTLGVIFIFKKVYFKSEAVFILKFSIIFSLRYQKQKVNHQNKY